MPSPAATVLIPVYNGMPYLREALESVLSQSFGDYELLIIDDGSKDGTADFVRTYSDPRIKLISRPNKGLIDTLNEGLVVATTSLIARFDADDICMTDRLARQMAFMRDNPEYVIVGSDIEYIDKDGIYLMPYTMPGHTDAEIRETAGQLCPFVHSAVMYRRDAVLAAGGYSAGAITFEDHLLWAKMLRIGKGYNLPESLIKVRFNPASVTVDEKWRGKSFSAIKYRSIEQGFVTPEDAATLKSLLVKQAGAAFKEASYYSMMGKKYIWNQPNGAKAREHLRRAIRAMPGKPEPYLLYLLSFFPGRLIKWLYQKTKQQ